MNEKIVKIGILTPLPNTSNGIAFITPLINWNKELNKRGIHVTFFNDIFRVTPREDALGHFLDM